MRIKTSDIASTGAAQFLLYYFVHAYTLTLRLKVENEDEWVNYFLNESGRVLFCGFHQQFFSVIRYFKKYTAYQPALMISRSRDGEIVARLAKRTGWYPIRGSSSRGGSNALKMMIEHLKTKRIAGHIVDGPRGPAQKIKPGVIRLAHISNAAIVPVYIAAKRAWYFNSWDRFLLPKPFTKVILKFGDLIKLDATENKQDFENQRQSLENTMHRELSMLKSRFLKPQGTKKTL